MKIAEKSPATWNKTNLFWAATVNQCYATTMNPVEGVWQKKGSANFLPWDLWTLLRRPGQDLSCCGSTAPWLLSALTEASWSEPCRKPCLKPRRKMCKQLGRFLRHLFLSSWKTEYLHKDRLLITQKRPNYENRKNSRLMNLDYWKTQEALTPVVLN